ncbi:hypothetical protein [Hymenobacter lapidiphilus]|uniref:Uncharacterized protein n=1 Tax=Hymenobacter lapidiphilus TaxID=2608003 RepID=A0A7Y7U7X1_9BACT|nr:hypothetical protein [Hymenobacter lapidiphilus]NVO33224.1 hypothetical protein [Hymenobacter lapidiphilus]
MPSPAVSFRPTPLAAGTAPTPAAAYALEQRLLRAYTSALKQLTEQQYQSLVATLVAPGGVMAPRRKPSRPDSVKLRDAREERIYDDVPELIRCFRPDEQPALALLLLPMGTNPLDLAGAVSLVLTQERRMLQREAPSQTLHRLSDAARAVGAVTLDDAAHCRAAGLGRISSQNYGRLHPGYLFRLPEPKVAQPKPTRRTAPRRAILPVWMRPTQLRLFA